MNMCLSISVFLSKPFGNENVTVSTRETSKSDFHENVCGCDWHTTVNGERNEKVIAKTLTHGRCATSLKEMIS